jgi:hypothetical protein
MEKHYIFVISSKSYKKRIQQGQVPKVINKTFSLQERQQ